MSTCRKALNFDLDTKQLEIHYPNKRWRKAYLDIRNFLLNNGFRHRMWSGYESVKPMPMNTVVRIVDKLSADFPWLKFCVKQFDVTNIGQRHSLLSSFSKSHEIAEPTNEFNIQRKVSFNKQIDSAAKICGEQQKSDKRRQNIENIR